ncbi:MAG: phosphoserine transaminase [Candidatus Competibacteraceae bacterium]|jgi:phosphoserine aminotransferase|nr:phosphoserine transaminase [Candidatus Competibacteraceae bacterium]
MIPMGKCYRYNFSAGPGALPQVVLDATQAAIRNVPEAGLSVLGISHRSDWFRQVVDELEANVRHLLGLPAGYHVLLLQGGGSLQFSMIPMTLLRGRSAPAEYLRTGYWSRKSIPEAYREGRVRVLWDGEPQGFTRLPSDTELTFGKDAAYFHYVSNETVEGLQFHRVLGREEVPRVCDMSSDFLSRPLEAERFALIYAHAQKNLGPAGVTLVILREELLQQAPDDLHTILDYRPHVANHSIYNTPPVFAIYVTLLVTRWLRDEIGGLAAMAAINHAKANLLYEVLDESDGFYRPRAAVEDRSLMNVAFNLPTLELEQSFLQAADEAGLAGLDGHRSIGGLRASLYNAVSVEAVAALGEFMRVFQRRMGRQIRSIG